MNTYDRLFGAGPRGAFVSLLLLLITCVLQGPVGLPEIMANNLLRYTIFGVFTVISLGIIAWSLVSLPPGERGRKLVIAGAFQYVRHPLYAAFVCSFVFGLAVLLNNWIYMIWAVLIFPFWQFNVRSEERWMLEHFGADYAGYCTRTWRFFPKLF